MMSVMMRFILYDRGATVTDDVPVPLTASTFNVYVYKRVSVTENAVDHTLVAAVSEIFCNVTGMLVVSPVNVPVTADTGLCEERVTVMVSFCPFRTSRGSKVTLLNVGPVYFLFWLTV